ncbi:MAG: winged helix DNA-binding protein [Planctomycetota bacterium]|nr:winged helix DNA-binding protein [Planctomycetota bacterium]
MTRSNTQTRGKSRTSSRRPEPETYRSLLRTMNVLLLQADRLLKQHGLSESTYDVLQILRRGAEEARQDGHRFAGLPCAAVAEQMITAVPDLTRLLDRLSQLGLVQRRRSEEDRRVVRVRLTAKGRRLIDALEKPVAALRIEQLGHMSRKDLGDLNRLLDKAVAPHEAHEE